MSGRGRHNRDLSHKTVYHEPARRHFLFSFSSCPILSREMTALLENFVVSHPDVTLSHTFYGQHFYLGSSVNISSTPIQRVQSFVENEGSPYRFLIFGQLSSFKVVEDAVSPLPVISTIIKKKNLIK